MFIRNNVSWNKKIWHIWNFFVLLLHFLNKFVKQRRKTFCIFKCREHHVFPPRNTGSFLFFFSNINTSRSYKTYGYFFPLHTCNFVPFTRLNDILKVNLLQKQHSTSHLCSYLFFNKLTTFSYLRSQVVILCLHCSIK